VRTDEDNPGDIEFDPSMTDPFGSFVSDSSLSGHERNVLFLSRDGRQFEDVSAISGVNDPADGRAVGLLDYDRDGWQDLVVVNANAPSVQLFRNEIGDLSGRRGEAKVVALRLVGGNRQSVSLPSLSNRDAIGARIEVDLGDSTLVRVLRAGEGFASQNSDTLLIGVGDASEVDSIRVHWPSGRVQESGPFPVSSLVTVREDPSGSVPGFEVEAYGDAGLAQGAAKRHAARERSGRRLSASAQADTDAPLRLLTTMATWCESCKGELPQIERLRATFPPGQVALLGIPIDEDDDIEKLHAYETEHHPAYTLEKSLSAEQIDEIRETVLEDLYLDVLPATIATDAEGRVIRTMWDLPSVSEVKELLETVRS